MNVLILISFMALITGSMLLVLDQLYYYRATAALLEKKIQQEYEKEGFIAYEKALKQKN